MLASNSTATTVLVMASGLLLAGCEVNFHAEAYRDREEKRFAVKGTPDVSLDTFDGGIEVRGWDRDEVLVEVEKQGASAEDTKQMVVTARQEGNRVSVEIRGPQSAQLTVGMHVSRQARIIASVPKARRLELRTGDGSVAVERIAGRIDVRSGDGSVRAYQVDGELIVDTSDGSVKLDDVSGRVDVRTGDGSILIGGKLQHVQARSGDGSITVKAREGSAVAENWDISTGDGTIALYVPTKLDAELDCETGDGRVRAEDGLGFVEAEHGAREEDGRVRALRGRLGSGGRVIHVRTNDGSITVRRW
jgi:DUF4097 and DUF4098 domain-containing protein YvlB